MFRGRRILEDGASEVVVGLTRDEFERLKRGVRFSIDGKELGMPMRYIGLAAGDAVSTRQFHERMARKMRPAEFHTIAVSSADADQLLERPIRGDGRSVGLTVRDRVLVFVGEDDLDLARKMGSSITHYEPSAEHQDVLDPTTGQFVRKPIVKN